MASHIKGSVEEMGRFSGLLRKHMLDQSISIGFRARGAEKSLRVAEKLFNLLEALSHVALTT